MNIFGVKGSYSVGRTGRSRRRSQALRNDA